MIGHFDIAALPEGWFAAELQPPGWFDSDLLDGGGIAAQTLTQSSTYSNSNTFYSHALATSINLSQSSRFDNAQTFYAHTLTPGAVALIQSARFDNSAGFYSHSLTPGAVSLVQSARFDNDATFFAHELSDHEPEPEPTVVRRTVGGIAILIDEEADRRERIAIGDDEDVAIILPALIAVMAAGR